VNIGKNQYMYSIVKCAKDWQNEIIKIKCENETMDEEIYDMVPVYSNQTRLVYRNIYCAYCNINSKLNVADHVDFLSLEADGYVTFAPHQNYNQKYLIQMMINDMLKNKHNHKASPLKFELKFKQPIGIKINNRTCVPAVDSCPEISSQIERELCQNHTAYRLGENKRIYKNEHCAICNGLKKDELSSVYTINSKIDRYVANNIYGLTQHDISFSLKGGLAMLLIISKLIHEMPEAISEQYIFPKKLFHYHALHQVVIATGCNFDNGSGRLDVLAYVDW
jgi:hypothetical protein